MAFPLGAQLGMEMTPAIARATDFRFRVMLVVWWPFAGGAAISAGMVPCKNNLPRGGGVALLPVQGFFGMFLRILN